MALINPAATVSITPQRPTEVFGEETFTDLEPIDAVVSLNAPTHGVNGRFTQDGTLFVPRGSDVKAADKFTYQGHEFRVVGWPRADQDHPVTGDDFGWVQYVIEGAS